MAALPPIVHRMAEACRGTVSRRDLLAVGIPVDTLEDWLAAGRLERCARGEYRLPGSEVTLHQALQVALNRAGAGARLAGPIVLGLWGIKGFAHLATALRPPVGGALPDLADLDHVAVPPGRRVRGVPFKVVRTALPAEDLDEVEGLPAVTVARSLAAAAKTNHPARIRSAYDDARFRGLVDEEGLQRTVARLGGGYGGPPMRRILGTGALRSESEGERDLLAVFRAGDPLPERQVWVRWHDRYFRLDFAFLAGRIDLEYDGGNHDGRREQDADRDLALAELRIHPLRITKRMLRDPEGTRRRILTVVRQRLALDLPPIVPEPPPWVRAAGSAG
jgi:hypothetical protein